MLGLLIVASIVPFWCAELLALTDWSYHLAGAAIAAAPERFSGDYQIALAPRPYLGLTYALVLLGRLMPLTVAGKLVLSAYALGLSLAARSLVMAAGRDRRAAWLAPLFVHSWPLAYGFVPYVLSIPPALWALASLRRIDDRPSNRRWAALFAAQLLAALMHPLGWGVCAFTSLFVLPDRSSDKRRWILGTALIAAFVVIAPQLARPADVRLIDQSIETGWRLGIKHKLLSYSIAYLPAHWDAAVAWVGAAALALGLIQSRGARADKLERAFWAMGALYLLAPVNLVALGLRVSLLSPRFVVFWALLALPLLRAKPKVWAPLGACAALGQAALLAHVHWSFDRTWGAEVKAAITAAPSGSKVLPKVQPSKRSVLHRRLVRPPEEALHPYVLLGRASYNPQIFSTPQSAVRTRTSAPAPDEPQRFDVYWQQDERKIEIRPVTP